MRFVRFHPEPESGPSRAAEAARDPMGERLNLLLSYAGWREDPWVDRLPKILEPMGVRAVLAATGREASDVIRRTPIHAAVVDLGLPLDERGEPESPEGGVRLLEILRRLETAPPVVVVKTVRGARDDRRVIAAALRAGAFAVVDRPHSTRELELMLETLRRLLVRHYRGRWPGIG